MSERPVYCSFCGKNQDEVSLMMVAFAEVATICNECVEVCLGLCRERRNELLIEHGDDIARHKVEASGP